MAKEYKRMNVLDVQAQKVENEMLAEGWTLHSSTPIKKKHEIELIFWREPKI